MRSTDTDFILVSLIRFERDIEKNLTWAKRILLEALVLYPYSKEILFESLRFYQDEDNLHRYAENAYLYGLRTHSKFIYNEALATSLLLGKLDLAKMTIDKLFSLGNVEPRALYLASDYYIKNNDYKEALKLLIQAHQKIKDNPEDSELAFSITHKLTELNLTLGDKE